MTRLSSILWVLPMALLAVASSSNPGDNDAPSGTRAELAPAAADQQELERKLAERTPPWLQRWQRMIDGREDELGRDPAEALRQARLYDLTMPSGAGPDASPEAVSANQTVPGDAWRDPDPTEARLLFYKVFNVTECGTRGQ